MKNKFYAMMARMKNIYRWGLMRNTRRENLSEHSLEVAQIAHALALIGNRRLGKNYNADFAVTAAVYHDSAEIITGDMPTPIKYYNDEIKAAYKQIEATAEKQLTDMLPDDFKEEFAAIYSPEAEISLLIKAADKISALIKCIEELNMGNREFGVAERSTRNAIKALKLQEADIFMEEFLPAFTLSLDELRERE